MRIRVFLAGVASVSFLTGQTPPNLMLLGDTAEYHLFLDRGRVKDIVYPMGAGGNLVGVLTPKTYREAWIRVLDLDQKLVGHYLWVFDCADRAGQLAAAHLSSDQKSYDVTSSAQSIGVERYMQRIPPGSFYEIAQPTVCSRKK